MEDYLDCCQSGLKPLLKAVGEASDEIDEPWLRAQIGNGIHPEVTDAGLYVYRALRHHTDGEARKVVATVDGGKRVRSVAKAAGTLRAYRLTR